MVLNGSINRGRTVEIRARNHQSGGYARPSVELRSASIVRIDQRLDDCRIVEETPSGFGFGEQALRAMAFFRYRPPMTASGRPIEGQRVTTFVNMGR